MILIFYTGMNLQADYITHKNRQRIKPSFILDNCNLGFLKHLNFKNIQIQTTERYTHVANTAQTIVVSPLDKINMNRQPEDKPP